MILIKILLFKYRNYATQAHKDGHVQTESTAYVLLLCLPHILSVSLSDLNYISTLPQVKLCTFQFIKQYHIHKYTLRPAQWHSKLTLYRQSQHPIQVPAGVPATPIQLPGDGLGKLWKMVKVRGLTAGNSVTGT